MKKIHPRRFLLTMAGRNGLVEKRMQEAFKRLADSTEPPTGNAIMPVANPIYREIERPWPVVDGSVIEMTADKITISAYKPAAVLYADGEPIEYQRGGSEWKCPYCGGIRKGDRCQGCGAPRTKAEER